MFPCLGNVPFVSFPLLQGTDDGALHADAEADPFEDFALDELHLLEGALPVLVPLLLKDLCPVLRERKVPFVDLLRVSERATCLPLTLPLPFPPFPFPFILGPWLPLYGLLRTLLMLG